MRMYMIINWDYKVRFIFNTYYILNKYKVGNLHHMVNLLQD